MRIALDPAHRVEHAKTFLSELLARGPVAVMSIRRAAVNAGWSVGVGWAAIKHAKQELGLIAFRQKGAWHWGWPDVGQSLTSEAGGTKVAVRNSGRSSGNQGGAFDSLARAAFFFESDKKDADEQSGVCCVKLSGRNPMSRYALAVIFAFFLGTLTSAQCLTTLPSNPPFVPPAPYPSEASNSSFWYGKGALWTALQADGKWPAFGKEEDGWVYRTKLVFWHRGFDWRTETKPDLIVTGKRLDGEAPTVAVANANAVFLPSREGAGMMTLIDIPKAGCWEIRAHYKGHDLSFVVSVEPEARR